MDTHEAAQILSVADHEVIDVKQDAGWWHALHHDMASHEETWRQVAPVPEAAPTEQVGDLDGDGVPDGNAKEVLDWVGEDRDRAAAALVAEATRDKPRSTLVAALEKLAG